MEILSLGEKIKRRRKELNMTLKDLAGERITPGQISLVESGKSNPSMDLLEYLAQSLNTSIEYLMESEESQAEKICIYYENLAEAYILNEDLTLGEQVIEKALYYAENYNLETRKAKNMYLRASIYMSKKEFALAEQYFLSANVIFIKNNNYEDTIKTFINLGKITLKLKTYHSACSYFSQAENVYNENDIGNDYMLGQIYYYIAYAYFKLDNTDKAINYSFLAKEKFEQLNNKKEYANSLLLLSEQHSRKGDINNAIKYSQKTLAIYREIEDTQSIADTENNLGKLFCEFENLEESFIHLNKAREIRERIGDAKVIETLINICENYMKLKDVEKCEETLESISDFLNDNECEARVEYYILKHRVELLKGNTLQAESMLLNALEYVKGRDVKKKSAEIAIMVGKFYMDYGKEEEAAKYLNFGVGILKSIGVIKEY